MFGEIAKANDFKTAFGRWYKESSECIAVLELQKSSYSNAYYLNINIFIQGAFDRIHRINKDVIKNPLGDVAYQITSIDILDLENLSLSDEKREKKINKLFCKFIVPYVDQGLSISGIKKKIKDKKVYLLPAVRSELGI